MRIPIAILGLSFGRERDATPPIPATRRPATETLLAGRHQIPRLRECPRRDSDGGLPRAESRVHRIRAGRTLLLQFDEQDVRRRLPRVLPAVGLGIQPSDFARIEAHLAALTVLGNEAAVE